MSETKSELVKGDIPVKLEDMVTFVAGYPKDFKGVKFMKDGKEYPLHRLHATRLEKKGIGKIKA